MYSQSLNFNNFLSNKFFDLDYLFHLGIEFLKNVYLFIFKAETINTFQVVLSVLAIFFIFIIVYTMVRNPEIKKEERKHKKDEIKEYTHRNSEQQKLLNKENGSLKNERWNSVLTHIFSSSSSDWKLAIMEADSMLEGLMDQLNFRGENLGEKLKSADRDKFSNLTSAWEVHTIRNKIAHEGLSFEISQHEAKRVIALYEKIFREFGYI